MTACTQPACTGTIIDEYCDVCGSPAGADPFVPAEAAASAAPATSLANGVPAPTPPLPLLRRSHRLSCSLGPLLRRSHRLS